MPPLLTQLHIYLPTDTSKSKLDLQQPSNVDGLAEGDAEEAPIKVEEVLGAIFRTLVENTFDAQLKALEQEAREAATSERKTAERKVQSMSGVE